ncbi:MAG: hypothetical protein ACFFBP_03670 [Promethearchaeota archaeon]
MREEDFNSKMLKIIRDIIKNNLPPPYPKDTPNGQRAWRIADTSLTFASEGRIKTAIRYMIIALRSGVPEPVNSHLRSLLIKLIDGQIKFNIHFNKEKRLLNKIPIA